MMLEVSASIVFLALCFGSLAIWLKLLRNFRQGKQTLPTRLRAPSPIGLIDVLLMFFGWIIAQTLGIGLAKAIFGNELEPPISLSSDNGAYLVLFAGISQLLVTIGCLGLYSLRYKAPSVFGLDHQSLFKNIGIGLVGFLVIIPPVLILQMVLSFLVPYEHDTLESLKKATSALPIVSAWLVAVLVAPIVEEVFFRGLLQGWLQRLGNTRPEDFGKMIAGGRCSTSQTIEHETHQAELSELTPDSNIDEDNNPYCPPETSTKIKQAELADADGLVYFDSKLRWSPIFVSAGLFAAAHIGQGAAPIPLFFLSVGLGYLYRQTGSIIPGIVVHFLLNFYSMFWATMAVVFNVGQ